MSEMRVLDRLAGDYRITWDPTNADDVAAARASFDQLAGVKKYLAFKVAEPGDKGEQIKAFDPQAGVIIMTPPMAGG